MLRFVQNDILLQTDQRRGQTHVTINSKPQTDTFSRRPLLALLIFAFGTGFSGAIMPGPLLAVTVKEAARTGFWAGPLLMIGHGALELTVIIMLALGLGAALRNRFVFAGLGLIGGAMLLWMGWGMLAPPDAGQLTFLHSAKGLAGTQPWAVGAAAREAALGLVTSLSNPYWTLWWATLGMALIARAKQRGAPGLGTLFAGHISSDVVWYCVVALGIAYGRSFLTVTSYRWLVGACGVFLIGLAGYFIYSGARGLVRPAPGQVQDG
jgi:threonine/homoserine/homoserine lactone efflux protein